MEKTMRPISQIFGYVALNYAGEGIKKTLVLSLVNVYGIMDEINNILYLYNANKDYIGMIELKCKDTIVNIIW